MSRAPLLLLLALTLPAGYFLPDVLEPWVPRGVTRTFLVAVVGSATFALWRRGPLPPPVRDSGGGTPWSRWVPPVPERRPVPDLGRYEDPDPVGDNTRWSLASRGFLASSLVTVVAVVIGDSEVRGMGILVLFMAGGLAALMGQTARQSARRMRRGRGLVAGDPLREEGFDPAEAPDDAEQASGDETEGDPAGGVVESGTPEAVSEGEGSDDGRFRRAFLLVWLAFIGALILQVIFRDAEWVPSVAVAVANLGVLVVSGWLFWSWFKDQMN